MRCEDCGRDFEGRIAIIDGKDKVFMKLCHDCKLKQQEQKYSEELKEALPKRMKTQREIWEDSCNMPALFRNKTFDNFDRKLQPRAFDMAKKYNPLSQSMLLSSAHKYGLGKTHLVCAIINREIATREPARIIEHRVIVEYPCPAYFATELGLLDRLRATFNDKDGETEEQVYRQVTRKQLLVIDDVGKSKPRDFGFLQGVYYRVIDTRYVNGYPTILTTNLDYNELEEHIGGACADRLREMCGKNILRIDGESYRKRKAVKGGRK